MIKIKDILKIIIKEAIKNSMNIKIDTKDIMIEVPNNEKFGDFSTNVAMQLASRVKMAPKNLATTIIDEILKNPNKKKYFKNIEVMGPGFINFYIETHVLNQWILEAIEKYEFNKFTNHKKEEITLGIVVKELQDLFNLENLRAFMNMYYLGNLYKAIGYKTTKLIGVSNLKDSTEMAYLLSNFKDIRVSENPEDLRDAIIFTSPKNQWLFKSVEGERFIVDKVKVYENQIEVLEKSTTELIELIGFDRLKVTLMTKPMTSEGEIEITKDDLKILQYPYSRISSIIKILKEEGISLTDVEVYDWQLIDRKIEYDLIKKLTEYKDTIKTALELNDPYRYIRYAFELTSIFDDLNINTLYRKMSKEKLLILLKLLNVAKIVFKDILTTLELPIKDKM